MCRGLGLAFDWPHIEGEQLRPLAELGQGVSSAVRHGSTTIQPLSLKTLPLAMKGCSPTMTVTVDVLNFASGQKAAMVRRQTMS